MVDGQPVEAVLLHTDVGRCDTFDHLARVGHHRVDLARRGVPLVGLAQLAQRQVADRELLEHQHSGDEARVGAEVVGEVVVRRVLAAEHRARRRHDLLDEAVTDPGANGLATGLDHDLGHGLGADEVVDDLATGLRLQDGVGEDRGRGRARQADPLLVDEEDAVGVAVERQPDVGTDLEHTGHEVTLVLGLDRIGGMVRERAVELAVHDLEVEREAVEHGGNDETAHAVGGVGHDLQRPERPDIDERTHVVGERAEHVAAGHRARGRGGSDARRGVVTDLRQTGVLTDGAGARQAELDAVVLGRVVRRREHGAGRVERAGGEVQEVGRAQTEVDDVEPL